MKTLAIAALCFLLLGCQSTTRQDTEPAERDTVAVWERSRQCSADTERLALRLQKESSPFPGSPQVVAWTSHYNRKEQRCFAAVDYYNPSAKGPAPAYFQELWDSIEALKLGSYTSQALDEEDQKIWCTVPDDERSTRTEQCDAVKRYILERMMQ